ncbi:MAG TPA: hypothetical protein VMW50_10735 [Dehalococcoidia bacterium]|nr:hypothetical protein [Dehalococcoidia bacterium]
MKASDVHRLYIILNDIDRDKLRELFGEKHGDYLYDKYTSERYKGNPFKWLVEAMDGTYIPKILSEVDKLTAASIAEFGEDFFD